MKFYFSRISTWYSTEHMDLKNVDLRGSAFKVLSAAFAKKSQTINPLHKRNKRRNSETKVQKLLRCFPENKTGLALIFTAKMTLGRIFGNVFYFHPPKTKSK